MMLCCGHGSVCASSLTSSPVAVIVYVFVGWERVKLSPACSVSALPSEVRAVRVSDVFTKAYHGGACVRS